MITFSFSSVLMTVLASNLLLVLITLFFRNEKLLSKIGYRVMAVFCIVTLARLLFPCELPFTKTVILPALISEVLSVLRHPYEIIPGLWISVTNVLCAAWLAGSIFFLCNAVWKHMQLRRLIRCNSKDVTSLEPYRSILGALGSEKECRQLRLLLSPLTGSPMIVGLLRPVILLPQNIDPADNELMLAIRHEFYHYIHHDLWLKFFTDCLSMFYWWNPFCISLKRRVGTLLEIRVDASIVSDDDTFTAYVASLLRFMRNSENHHNLLTQTTGLTFSNEDGLKQRIYMMQNRKTRPSYIISVTLLLLTFGMYIGSYLIVFENASYMYLSEELENYTLPEESNGKDYAVQNTDGTYTVYLFDGRYTEVIDSLEYYPGIVVYSSKEEYDETVQKNQ